MAEQPMSGVTGVDPQAVLLERLSRAIDTCQKIHDDSRTPLDDAIKLMEQLRTLHRCRQALRTQAFQTAANNSQYQAAVSALKKINDTLKAEVMAHNRTLEFVNDVAMAAAAVLDLAIAVGALAA